MRPQLSARVMASALALSPFLLFAPAHAATSLAFCSAPNAPDCHATWKSVDYFSTSSAHGDS
jgi:hypothetical protein